MQQTNLSIYNNYPFNPGGNVFTRLLWHYVNAVIFKTGLLPVSGIKVFLLRLFGAKIGTNVMIKPCVNIKYPWNLTIDNNSWIGENVWIDNLVPVTIGSHVCISQGAYLCTGNHDWSDPSFGLIVKPISVADGAWIGAKSVIAPGIQIGESAIAAAGSVVVKDIPSFEIHAGNPAQFSRRRVFQDAESAKSKTFAQHA